jgi:retron-type reverse transcriptase
MKRISNLYSKIYDFENLYEAYLEARKGKRYRHDVMRFTANLEENLIQIQNELIYKTYQVGRYNEFFCL